MSSNYPKHIVGVVNDYTYSNYMYMIRQLKRIGYTTPATMPIECDKCFLIIDVTNSFVSAYPITSDEQLNMYKNEKDYIYCGDVDDNYFIVLAKYFYINQTQCGKDLFTFWIHEETGAWHYCSDKKFCNYNKNTYRLATISEIVNKMKSEEDMCPYCKGKRINTEDHYINVHIKDDHMYIEYDAYSCDSSFNDSIQIKYCPMCGRKL